MRTSETDFNRLTKSGYYFGKLTQNTPDGTTDSNWIAEVQAFDNSTGWTFQRAARSSDKAIFTRIQDNGTWSDWEVLARKSDLTDIIMVKSFRGTSITVAGNASEKISIPISTPTGYKVVGKISEWWNNGPEMYLSQVDLTPTTFTGYAANLKNSETTSIPAISVLFVKS